MNTPAPPTARVVFLPSGRRGEFATDTPLLDAARDLGVDIESICGGRGICGRCQITVAEGEFAKHAITSHARHLSPAADTEIACAEKRHVAPERRLACQARIRGDLIIDVPPDAQAHRQVVVKDTRDVALAVDAVTRLYYIETPTPTPETVRRALADQWGLADLTIDTPLPDTQTMTVAVRNQARVVAAWPGFRDKIYGASVDVGSTTLAAQLCDLETGAVLAERGAMNPQIKFGEDVMSRVSYVMLNPQAAPDLTTTVQAAINQLIADVATDAGIEVDAIVEVTAVGNPIMHHMLLGLDARPLGQAPFPLQTETAERRPAPDLGLSLNPGAEVYVLPPIAGHVGADTAAVILAERPDKADEMTLICDVGTNAEIVLGNRDRLLAASSPTGPAFEGAEISSGQRAAPGAIERVRIDPATGDVRVRVIGCDLWSDDKEFAAATARTGITGICGSGIIEALAEMVLARILTPDGIIDGSQNQHTGRIIADGRTFAFRLTDGVTVTQKDVRAIQLAKAALYAGARLLMEKMGVTTVDRILLAGAFGARIDPLHAMVLGLIPDCDPDRVVAVGNAAGLGARAALLDGAARTTIEALVKTVEKIETATEPGFQDHFVAAMAFPHKTDPFTQLARRVDLPPRTPAGGTPQRRQRRKKGG